MKNQSIGEPNLCNIYAQEIWHDPVIIVANRETLKAFQIAIAKLLETDQIVAQIDCMASDGEGFQLSLAREDSVCSNNELNPWGSDVWNNLCLPYTEEYAKSSSGSSPWDIFKKNMA